MAKDKWSEGVRGRPAPSSGVYGQRREQRLEVLHLFLYIKESERDMKRVDH